MVSEEKLFGLGHVELQGPNACFRIEISTCGRDCQIQGRPHDSP